jgi:hypothetical protein
MNLALACKTTGHTNPATFAAYVQADIEGLRRGVVAGFQNVVREQRQQQNNV